MRKALIVVAAAALLSGCVTRTRTYMPPGYTVGQSQQQPEEQQGKQQKGMMEIKVTTAQAGMPLIGEKAPAFEAETTKGKLDFPKDYQGKWVVFFSHPSDFTPVCTTEFMKFASMQDEFKAINCELLGLSVDSVYSHIAWIKEINQQIQYQDMKNVNIDFPIVADPAMQVAQLYGMVQPQASTSKAVRAVFIIDTEGIVQGIIYYPLSNGRNIQEIKRAVTAMQRTAEYGVATPAEWRPGEDVIVPPPSTEKAAKQRLQEARQQGYNCQSWFLCLKPDPGAERQTAKKQQPGGQESEEPQPKKQKTSD